MKDLKKNMENFKKVGGLFRGNFLSDSKYVTLKPLTNVYLFNEFPLYILCSWYALFAWVQRRGPEPGRVPRG